MKPVSLTVKPFVAAVFFTVVCTGLLLLPRIAGAQTYKCTEDGVTSFSQQPCKSGASAPITLHPDDVTPEARQQALIASDKEKTELRKLQENRHREEATAEKQRQALAAKIEKKKQQCASLQLKEKWAAEDLANTTEKNAVKAKSRLKRANEKSELFCKGY